ncbi:hypothetical protein C8J56DRAFT_797940 [Mycena floridula]|nr:hypothetical protein C8J56DRAFT_797940 [Mycena floridula]
MDPPTYSISAIPVPPSDKDVQKYTDFRLLNLKTDPQFFSTKYKDAVLMTEAQWKERLNSVDKVTIYATFEGSGDEAEWAGMITILAPECLALFDFRPPEESDLETYMIVGMWVHPEHRQRGVAKKLIEAGKTWARSRAANETKGKRLALEVNDFNDIARKLYKSAGFVELDLPRTPDDKEGHIWMVALI